MNSNKENSHLYVKNKPKYQQIETILQFLGWFDGRVANIEDFKHLALLHNCGWTKAINMFCNSYADLDECIYLGFDEDTVAKFDFVMRLTPDEAAMWYKDPVFRRITKYSGEPVLCLGSFGYYYEGVIAIGESGKLYVAHDYNDEVKSYDSLNDAIEGEFLPNTVISVISNHT